MTHTLATVMLLMAMAASAAAQKDVPVDTRVLIDISGSMKQNDPKNLRRSALRLLVGLLPAETRSGVWTFGQYVNMQVKLGVVDEAWKKRARKGAGEIHSRGLFTHIEGVLKRSTEDWETPTDAYRRSVILLTDGMVDISKQPAKNRQSRDRILNDIIPRLKSLGVTIHTIALSERADHELMRELADSSGGWYEQVNDADRLQRVFLRIFEKVGRPDTVPLKDNRFNIDSSISEATLLVFRKEGGEPTRVQPPEGDAFDAKSAPPNVQWHRDSGYDLLTISNPQPGEWSIKAEIDPDNRVMIVTDLKLKATELPNRLLVGERAPIEVHFTDKGKMITEQQFLEVVDVTAEHQDSNGLSEPRPLLDDGASDDQKAGDGLFTLQFGDNLSQGTGELIINAKGSTFVREQRQRYEVVEPGSMEIMPNVDGSGSLNVRVVLAEDVFEPEQIKLVASLENDRGEPSSLSLEMTEETFFQGRIDPATLLGEHQLKARLMARTVAGNQIDYPFKPITIKGTAVPAPMPEPKPEPAPAVKEIEPPQSEAAEPVEAEAVEEEDEMIRAAIIFGIGNLVLILVGGGIYWFIRRRKKDDLSLDDDEDDEAGKDDEEVDQNSESEAEEKGEAGAGDDK